MAMLMNNDEYLSTIEDVKKKIKDAQHRAVLSVNAELVELYWNIGIVINEHSVWGNKFVDNLARDIKLDFPNTKGYSVRNLKYMAKFARVYPDSEFVQRTVAQIPWRHNIALLDKVKDESERHWYVQETITNGWSRDWLVSQIESQLYQRQAIDDLLKSEHDNPSIGLILCKNKKGMIAEYSLRDIEKPIGVSEYKLFDKLPKKYEEILPSTEDIEKRIGPEMDSEDADGE